MLKKSLLGVLLTLALTLGLVAAQSADACCVYNDTGLKIKAAWTLASDWHLSPHSHKCQEGKGGTLSVIDDKSWAKDVPLCMNMSVAKHGYVKIKQDDNTFTVTSYRHNGTVNDKCRRTIYSAPRVGLSEKK